MLRKLNGETRYAAGTALDEDLFTRPQFQSFLDRDHGCETDQ